MREISKSLEKLLSDIYEDGDVSLMEFKALQVESDLRWGNVVDELGNNNTLLSFQSSMDVAMHLLFLSLNYINNQEITDVGEAIVKDAIAAQVETLRAGAELSLKQLKVGPNTL
ncbi:MAG: hypothetical protein ACRC1I_26805 [Pseudomonas proteolytica]|uniref:hypothetical protein n=1 Tax=Pseudomonas proteolytica TaxID=219574 RepID=UPI003F2EFA59